MVARGRASSRPRLPRRGAVYRVGLDPTRGSEIKKSRPCVVVSPDPLNENLRTVIIAPLTTGGRPYPWRVTCRFQEQEGCIALDQLRTVDRQRLVDYMGELPEQTMATVLANLVEMFVA